MIISKNSQNWIEIKFEIENVDFLRYELKILRSKLCSISAQKMQCSGWMDGWMDGWMGGWMDGWMGVKAGLRIAYSNQKFI